MDPIEISAVLTLLEAAVTKAPQIVQDVKDLFAKPDPTRADWQALRDKVNSKGYFDYVPDSSLPR